MFEGFTPTYPRRRATIFACLGEDPDDPESTIFEKVQKGEPDGMIAYVSRSQWNEILESRAKKKVDS